MTADVTVREQPPSTAPVSHPTTGAATWTAGDDEPSREGM